MDVIFQCADDKYDAGARDVVSSLMERSKNSRQASAKYLSLCLRVMNAAPLPPRSTDAIFDALAAWGASPELGRDTALAVFELSRDPRNRFIAKLRADPLHAKRALTRWARFYWRGETLLFDPQWDQQMYEVALDMENPRLQDPPAMAYLLRNSPLVPDQLPPTWEWALGFQAFGEPVPGPVALDMEELLAESGQSPDTGQLTAAFGASLRAALPQVNDAFVRTVFARIGEATTILAPDEPAEAARNRDIRAALIWACCALFEATAPAYHPFHRQVTAVLGQRWFDRVSSTRTNGPGRTVISGPEPFSWKELRTLQVTGAVPSWFADWCAGQKSLLTTLENRPQPGVLLRRPTAPRLRQ